MSGHKDARSTRILRARNSDEEDPREGWAPAASVEIPHGPTQRPFGRVGVLHHRLVCAMSLSREDPPDALVDHEDPVPATWARYPPRVICGQNALLDRPRPPESGSA